MTVKKLTVVLLVLTALLAPVACGKTDEFIKEPVNELEPIIYEPIIFPEVEIIKDNIIEINVYSQPPAEERQRTFTNPEKITTVVDLLSKLILEPYEEFYERAYAGMSYVITIYYEDGTDKEYVNLGNMMGNKKDDFYYWYKDVSGTAELLERRVLNIESD